MIIPYIIKGSRNAQVLWSKILWFRISQPSKTAGDPSLWPFSIISSPTSINLSCYTGLGCEQELAFSAVASTIHGHTWAVSRVKNIFAVPYSMLKSLYLWPLTSQGSSLQSSSEKFKTDRPRAFRLWNEKIWDISVLNNLLKSPYSSALPSEDSRSHRLVLATPSPIEQSLANI